MRSLSLVLLILAVLSLPALSQEQQPQPPAAGSTTSTSATQPDKPRPAAVDPNKQQPQRILGVMPNFRAVSAGEQPPPPTPKQSFILATRNSFDYSSFVFVGITSAIAEWSEAHPEFRQGMPGFARYYWHGLADKTVGNYMVLFVFPTILHEDERYYSLGQGGFWKRATYASTRIFITPNYQGHNTFNAAEIFGRGSAQAISAAYYPTQSRTAGKIAQKYAYALGRDALTNVFREFWPDISTHVLHRKPAGDRVSSADQTSTTEKSR